MIQYNNYMEKNVFQSNREPQKQYARVPLHIRRLLVSKVQSGTSILKAARELQVKPSTAKRIVRRFKEQGTFFESRKMKQLRIQEEQHLKRESQMAIMNQMLQKTPEQSNSNSQQEPIVFLNTAPPAPMGVWNHFGVVALPLAWCSAAPMTLL